MLTYEALSFSGKEQAFIMFASGCRVFVRRVCCVVLCSRMRALLFSTEYVSVLISYIQVNKLFLDTINRHTVLHLR